MPLSGTLSQLIRNDRQPALFVGAGISKEAGIPLAFGVIQELKRLYPKRLKKPATIYQYAEAFKEALPDKAQRRQFFEEICSDKPPHKEHNLIAHLVEHKIFSIVFTTNFDHLTELAMTYRCSPQPRVYLYDVDIEPPEYSSASPKVLKLHGDFLFDDMANLDEELQRRLSENMRRKLQTYLSGRGLVVVGYGGNDETIMQFLEQLAESPEGMKDGLWWIICKEEEKKKDSLVSLIEKMNAKGKLVEIVGPTDAVTFFTTICNFLSLPLPAPIPFGIKPKRNLITSYTQRFGRLRQLPPLDVPQSLDCDREAVLKKFRNAVKSSGVIWLFGPPESGKSTLISKLASELDSKRVFYFSPRFALRPASLSLRLDLEGFAGGFGITILSYDEMLCSLFKKNVVLVFDDVCSDRFPMDINTRLFRDVLEIIAIREQVNKGTVILSSSSQPTNEDLSMVGSAMISAGYLSGQIRSRGLLAIDIPSPVEHPQKIFPESDDALLPLLSVMSLLRVAEYSDALARLCSFSHIDAALKQSRESGLMEGRVGKYFLRNSARDFIESTVQGAETNRLDLAKGFEDLSAAQPFFRRLHYSLEAENQYRRGGYNREGLLQFLRGFHVIALWEDSEAARSIFQYYLSVVTDRLVLSTLEPEQLLGILQAYRHASEWGHITIGERGAVEKTLRQVISAFGEPYQDLFDGNVRLLEKDFDNCGCFLLKAERGFRETSNYKALAWVLFDLSVCAFEIANNAFDEKRPEYIDKAVLWAREAESLRLKLGDDEGVANARDHRAKGLLNRAKFREALHLERQALSVHARREGFSEAKGVVYGNLFVASLGAFFAKHREDDLIRSEGYFHQSNLNFAQRDQWAGVLTNYSFLFNYCLKRKQGQGGVLPQASWVYRLIIESAILRAAGAEGPAVLQVALKVNSTWFLRNLRPLRSRSAIIAFSDCLRLGETQWRRSIRHRTAAESEALRATRRQSLVMVGLLIAKVGKLARSKILDKVKTESATDVDIYTCFCEWVINPESNLNHLLAMYDVAELKDYFEQAQADLKDVKL
jgi:hypothetical protein